jgi:hypothetical protein
MNLRLEKQKEMPAKKRPLKTNPHKPVEGTRAVSIAPCSIRPDRRGAAAIPQGEVHYPSKKDQGGIPPWSNFYPRKPLRLKPSASTVVTAFTLHLCFVSHSRGSYAL